MFILLSKEIQFDENFRKRSGIDSYLRLPMSNESVVIPPDLLQALMKILTGFKGVGKTNDEIIKNLIDLLNKYDTILSRHID